MSVCASPEHATAGSAAAAQIASAATYRAVMVKTSYRKLAAHMSRNQLYQIPDPQSNTMMLVAPSPLAEALAAHAFSAWRGACASGSLRGARYK
jgi:hypothetical protein